MTCDFRRDFVHTNYAENGSTHEQYKYDSSTLEAQMRLDINKVITQAEYNIS
jgi:hypothetical protein